MASAGAPLASTGHSAAYEPEQAAAPPPPPPSAEGGKISDRDRDRLLQGLAESLRASMALALGREAALLAQGGAAAGVVADHEEHEDNLEVRRMEEVAELAIQAHAIMQTAQKLDDKMAVLAERAQAVLDGRETAAGAA
ncbi:dynein heavy chain [Micractinium conductrix]|uniref:Dynein heavy chain n=1 Tax=Micractinium conductrix TaxID=554055 RepID=A0A2P6V841_9CHLO|nr:dynein heavy chain [Micractinium conductrix]|eukprot:PSC70260.1 dynein heavy chain [Micractinium conductrix]